MKITKAKAIAVLLVILFAGCANMKRKEVIEACKECTDAGMRPILLYNGLDGEIREVICVIKVQP